MSGFTLVELIIVGGLISVLSVFGYRLFADNLAVVRAVSSSLQGQADARMLLERLAREVREVKYVSSSPCIGVISGGRMRFNKTVGTGFDPTTCGGSAAGVTPEVPPGTANNDMWVDFGTSGGANTCTPGNSVQTTLTMAYKGSLWTANNNPSTLATDVNAFCIEYLQADLSTSATTAAQVRYVRLTITVQPPGAQPTSARTVIALRNG